MHGSSNFPAANNLRNHLNRTERPVSIYDNLTSTTTPGPSDSTPEKVNQQPGRGTTNGSPYINVSVDFEKRPDPMVSRSNSGTYSRNQPYTLDKPVGDRSQDIELQDMASNHKPHQDFHRKSNEEHSYAKHPNGEDVNHVKPVISDAKSKFFGLSNGQQRGDDIHKRCSGSESSEIKPATNEPPNQAVQPRYQNVPANSALFRKHHSSNPTTIAATPTNEMQRDTTHENCISSDSDSSGRIPNMDDRLDHSNRSTKYDMSSPSQVSDIVYMSTTVPQNIKGINIAGRHTPTRNSLRHSRMLVINTNYQGVGKPNPLRLNHPSSTRTVLIISLIIGIIISCIGIWITIWAPNTRTQDNPYWSGLTLLCASSLGLFTQQFRREKRQKYREGCFCALKVLVILLTCIATFLCAAAFIFATIHYANLASSNTNCSSANILVPTDACICIFGQEQSSNSNDTKINGTQTHSSETPSTSVYSFHYVDLSCSEVNGTWLYTLIASMLLNALGFLFGACFFILLFWKRKKSLYSSVRSNPF